MDSKDMLRKATITMAIYLPYLCGLYGAAFYFPNFDTDYSGFQGLWFWPLCLTAYLVFSEKIFNKAKSGASGNVTATRSSIKKQAEENAPSIIKALSFLILGFYYYRVDALGYDIGSVAVSTWTIVFLAIPMVVLFLLWSFAGMLSENIKRDGNQKSAECCDECGAKINESAKFCSECGHENTETANTEPTNYLSGVVGCVIAAAVALLILNSFAPINRAPEVAQTAESRRNGELLFAAIENLNGRLKDPGSAKITYLKTPDDGIAGVCGVVNSKNSFGGYSGPKKFIATGVGTVFSSDSGFAPLWAEMCQ